MQKPIIAVPKGAEALNHVAVRGGTVTESDASHYRTYQTDYAGPDQLVPRDALDKALKIDKAPRLEHGRLMVSTAGGRPLAVPFEPGDADDFPERPTMREDAATLALPGLVDAIRKVRYAAATDDVRYYLRGVCLEILGGRVSVTATDGHRLHTVELAAVAHDSSLDTSIIIPSDVARHISSDTVAVGKDETGRQRIEAGELSILGIDGRYPDWRRLFRPAVGSWSVDRAELRDYLTAYSKTLSTAQRRRGGGGMAGIVLDIQPGRLTLLDTERRELAMLNADVQCPAYETALAVTYLLDMLAALDGERFDAETTSPVPGGSDCIQSGGALVMPQRQ